MSGRNGNGAAVKTQGTRCAIYTRKSTEEGLEQEFNSLDAQRESAEAYIASQRHEGWECLTQRYDDGGFSGGSIERPALKRLLADIEAGDIDCVVVYKVDRLSRSLLDFSRLMEVFDRQGVSFVSVTQQFNTTNSMGRLTLNILLSFAQFEREIIAERTKDKMSAARRKGKWVGGMPMLGYDIDPKGGRLLVNEDEADQVRAIYELYLDLQALIPVVEELERRGWRSKHWVTRKSRERGGRSFTKNSLYRLLTNIIYIGKVDYQGTVYKGEHPPIIDAEMWQRVQSTLKRNGQTGGKDVRNKYGALLKGLIYCEPCGTAMVHTYTVKNSKRYRYYVCLNAQQRGWHKCPTKSINAHTIESAVVEQVRGMGRRGEIMEATVAQAREQSEKRLAELATERSLSERELKRLYAQLRKLVDNAAEATTRAAVDQMGSIQERIAILEDRMNAIRQELFCLKREAVDERDLARALAVFDPVWDSLAPREQARIIRLLVERVGYDGRDGRVTVCAVLDIT